MPHSSNLHPIAHRFRGYLPVVVDVETGGFNPKTDALLELAAVLLFMDERGHLQLEKTLHYHIVPFEGANLEKSALDFLGLDPFNPLRFALPEVVALTDLFDNIKQHLKQVHCSRAVLVGHNPTFDLSFIQAATERARFNNSPFHQFTTLDTATLGALFYKHTVLAKLLKAAKIPHNLNEAHSALYDAEQTARLFCKMVNEFDVLMSGSM